MFSLLKKKVVVGGVLQYHL